MVPPASHKVSRASWYSGSPPEDAPFALRDSHPLWSAIPGRSSQRSHRDAGPTTPSSLARERFGLLPFRSPLLWESRLITLRRATEMFQFAHFPPHALCVQAWVSRHNPGGVAPFGYFRIIACMQLPLNVSPVSASFIGLQRLGIHLVLCVACSLSCLHIYDSIF